LPFFFLPDNVLRRPLTFRAKSLFTSTQPLAHVWLAHQGRRTLPQQSLHLLLFRSSAGLESLGRNQKEERGHCILHISPTMMLTHSPRPQRQVLFRLTTTCSFLAVVYSFSSHSFESVRLQQSRRRCRYLHQCSCKENDYDQIDWTKSKTEENHSCRHSNRRTVLSHLASSSLIATAAAFWTAAAPQVADAAVSPLFQSSSYQNGFQQLPSYVYQKKDTAGLSSDPDELLASLKDTVTALKTLADADAVAEGRFDAVSQLLRGRLVSESQLRLQGYALLDALPGSDNDNDDDGNASNNGKTNIEKKKAPAWSYVARERFRIFLIKFSVLDDTVEAAARRRQADGGLVETVGMVLLTPFNGANRIAQMSQQNELLGAPNAGDDERFAVLAALADATQALQAFTTAAENALDDSSGNSNKQE